MKTLFVVVTINHIWQLEIYPQLQLEQLEQLRQLDQLGNQDMNGSNKYNNGRMTRMTVRETIYESHEEQLKGNIWMTVRNARQRMTV